MKARLIGLMFGAFLGVFFGTGTGNVIGGGGGMAGIWVFGALGALIGGFAATDVVTAWTRV